MLTRKLSILVLLCIIVTMVLLIADVAVAAVSKSPVTDVYNQGLQLLALASMISTAVAMFSRGKVKAGAEKLATKSQELAQRMGTVDPRVVRAANLMFGGAEGRRLGAHAGLDLVLENNPDFQVTAPQLNALIDHYSEVLAKIGKKR